MFSRPISSRVYVADPYGLALRCQCFRGLRERHWVVSVDKAAAVVEHLRDQSVTTPYAMLFVIVGNRRLIVRAFFEYYKVVRGPEKGRVEKSGGTSVACEPVPHVVASADLASWQSAVSQAWWLRRLMTSRFWRISRWVWTLRSHLLVGRFHLPSGVRHLEASGRLHRRVVAVTVEWPAKVSHL